MNIVTSTMAKPSTLAPLLLLLVVLKHLVATTHAFVVHPATSSSRYPYSTAPISFRLEMGGDKEIEVVSKPDEDFLAKKGCVVHHRADFLRNVFRCTQFLTEIFILAMSPPLNSSIFIRRECLSASTTGARGGVLRRSSRGRTVLPNRVICSRGRSLSRRETDGNR
jgi:hypothetical protein